MFRIVDNFLNQITMYRLLLYYLIGLLAVAVGFSAAGILPYNPVYIIASAGFLAAVSWLFNAVVARIWKVPMNAESSLLTALILALIINPDKPSESFFFLLWAVLLAMASKYIIAIRGKHVFNPAAFGVAATALFLDQSATWWVGGSLPMLPFVLVGGMLVVRKLRRSDLVLAFLGAAILATLAPVALEGGAILPALTTTLVHASLFFFAFVMLTEPQTTPPRRLGRILYGALVGFLFTPWVHIFSVYFTPELALLFGNVFSYLISPKFKAVLKLKEIREIATGTYEFVFAGRTPKFSPGQYAEWTLASDASDARGNRRYFTLASSPTEQGVRLGVKFYDNPSTFKKTLANFTAGSMVLAGSIAGDFTLPRDKKQKLVFIAGGIGVTPFRSMVKYLLDSKEERDAVLFYSNKTEPEIAYRDLFDEAAAANPRFRVVYTLTDKTTPPSWTRERGYVDAAMIEREVPDYKERTFYISGPNAMVTAFRDTLRHMGIPRHKIKTDYFPGFA
ncbi:MAG: RnfABCDGE type electron transport complex subunit D [bacterium]|nr:RnfABCDGE type electron transport complex subunit D [bacterium]